MIRYFLILKGLFSEILQFYHSPTRHYYIFLRMILDWIIYNFRELSLLEHMYIDSTICPWGIDLFNIVSYYTNLVKTSWTDSSSNNFFWCNIILARKKSGYPKKGSKKGLKTKNYFWDNAKTKNIHHQVSFTAFLM